MSELGPEAKALLEAEREARADSDSDRTRVRGLLAASLGASALSRDTAAAASAAAGTGASVTPAATGLLGSAAAKLVAASAVAGAIAVGVAVVDVPREAAPSEAAAPRTPPPEQTVAQEARALPKPATARAADADPLAPATPEASTDVPTPQPTAAPSAAPASKPSARQARAQPAATPMQAAPLVATTRPLETTATHGPTLQAELAALGAVQGALRQGDAAGALVYLERHAERYPNGALRQERMAARAVALCMLGRHAEGREQATALAREAPESPLLGRVRGACAAGPPEVGAQE